MKKWHFKLLKDNIKSLIPFQKQLRRWKRELSPYQTNFENDMLAIESGIEEIEMLRRNGIDIEGKSVLEIGSGWSPVIPILYSLVGARCVHMTDMEQLMDERTILNALSLVRKNSKEICNRLNIQKSHLMDVVNVTRDSDRATQNLSNLNNLLRLEYHVPFDQQKLEDNSVDIVCSRAVLEHISKELLIQLFTKFHRILKADGVMCHIIDNSDHWEHKDKSISRINFLKYEDLFWQFTCWNSQNYQNRLRHHEYVELFNNLNYTVIEEKSDVDSQSLKDLIGFPLALKFRGMPEDSLAAMTSYFVLKPFS